MKANVPATLDRYPSIESVPFRDDAILAARGPDDKIQVVIRRICESLGVDFSSQLTKLKGHHWSGVAMIATPDGKGSLQKHSVIPLDRLPMWLATMDARKVAESARPKLIAYQTEAADVLARHFFGQGASGLDFAIPDKDPLLSQVEALCEVVRRQIEHGKRIAAVEHETVSTRAIAESADAKADAALAGASGNTGFVTLLGYCNLHKIQLTRAEMASVGLRLRKACDAAGIPARMVPNETYGKVNVWPIDMLDQWLGSEPSNN